MSKEKNPDSGVSRFKKRRISFIESVIKMGTIEHSIGVFDSLSPDCKFLFWVCYLVFLTQRPWPLLSDRSKILLLSTIFSPISFRNSSISSPSVPPCHWG